MKPSRFAGLTLSKTAFLLFSFVLLPVLPALRAADRIKLNNTVDLNLSGSWTGGVPDRNNPAVWNNTVTGANSSLLGGSVMWQGIRLVDPGGAITIGPGGTLTLGAGPTGISLDLSAATQNLTIQSGLTLKSTIGQLWNIAAGRTLTLETGLFTRGEGATLNIQGGGTVITTTLLNDPLSGLIGTWATLGTGVTTRYAMVDGSNTIVAYTGGTAAATAASVTDTTGLVNYDVAAVGALGAGASVNTLRYTGGAGTISGNFTANGILHSGTGGLTLSGNVTIGAKRELVLMNGDSSSARDLTFSGIIGDSLSGVSGLTKGGLGAVTLSGANTYNGVTQISRGRIILTSGGSLGSNVGGTRIGLSGKLTLAGGVTSSESLFLDDLTNAFGGGNLIENLGTNTLTGAIRLSDSVRWQSGGTQINVTGGISTSNGNSGTSFVAQAGTIMNITGKPLALGGGGALYMDNGGKTIILGVAGSTYGSNSLYAGTLQSNVTNALSTTATVTFSVGYAAAASILDLNGYDQGVGGITTAIFSVHGAYDRVISSATAATLTTGINNASTTFDGRLTGAVSLVKVGTGTLNLTGASTTTGSFTVNGGTLNLTFGRAFASQDGAGAVSDYLPASAPLTLGGGTFQLTGRNNGTATSLSAGTWVAGQPLIAVASTAGLAPGQLVTGTNIPPGAFVVSVLNTTQFIISALPSGTGSGTAMIATANSFTTSQTFAGLTLNPGASSVTVTIPASGSDGTVLNLGAITANNGATVNFTLPAGTQSATNGITTSTLNGTGGILGGWARVGNSWAINSTNTVGGNLAALTAYTDVNRLGGMIASAPAANLRFVEGGASGSVVPVATGTTDINTLLQSATGATTYDPGSTDVLRLGEAGGILVANNAGALTIGATVNDGILTAGGAANQTGTLYLSNTHLSNLLTVNSTVADNGTGVVNVTSSGPGTLVLTGANTYTGRTTVGGGTLRISSEQNLGSNPLSFSADHLTLAGGTLNATASFSLDDSNRGITLAAAGGTISVNGGFTLTVANVMTGPGNLTLPGAGTLALTAANTHRGATFANTGTLALGHVLALQNSTLTTATAGNLTFTLAGTNTYQLGGLAGNDTVALGGNSLRLGSNDETTIFSGSLNGTGGFIKEGSGTLNLIGINTHSGVTRIEGGMIVLAHANALQNSTLDTGEVGTQSANFTLAEGTTYNIGGLKGSAALDLALSHLSVGANNESTTFSGVLQGAFSNNLTKVGSGSLTLAGNNRTLGTMTVSGGSLIINGTNFSDITVANGANLGGEGSTRGNLVFQGSTHSLEVNAATAAALGSTDAGGLNVSALNVGGFTINLSGSPIGSAPVKVLTYGRGGFTGDVNRFSLGTHTASVRGAGGFTNNGIDAIVIDLGYVINTWVGGAGVNPTFWDVATTPNWSNAKDAVFQNGDDVLFGDGALNLTPVLQTNLTAATVTFTNSIGTDYTLSSSAGQFLTTLAGLVFNGSGNVTIQSLLSGAGTLTQSGTGTTTLTAANTFTGGTKITSGTLRLSDEASLGTAPAVFTANHLLLDGINATFNAVASFFIDDLNRGITLGTGGGSFKIEPATSLTLATPITGPGALRKLGGGTLILTGANTYTGLTTVDAGTLELNRPGGTAVAGDGIAGSRDLQVNTGGTLRLGAGDQIANDGTVYLNGGTWNLNGQSETILNLEANVATTAPALILGTGSILTLNRIDWDNTGANVTSNLTGGALRFVANGVTQPIFETNYVGTVNIASTVQIDATSLTFRSATFGTTVGGQITGAGKLIYDGTGGAGGLTLTNGTNNYAGGTQWTSTSGVNGAWNLFTVSASGALGSGEVTIQGGNQNTWVSTFVGTPSAFTFTGATTHANDFRLTGAATISVGTPTSVLPAADTVNLSGAMDLDVHRLFLRGRGTGTISGEISGSGGLSKIDDPGTWILTGSNTYSGETTVSAGTLIVNGNNSAATGAVTVATGATLGGNGIIGGDTTVNGTLSTGALATAGSVGTLNFNGNDLTFGGGSVWLVDLVQGAVESSDAILANALTIGANSTLNFQVSGTFNGDESYTLATYSGLSGTFANYATSGAYVIGGNSYVLNYGTNTITLSAIPEPGTLGLLGLALGGFFLRRFRKRRA